MEDFYSQFMRFLPHWHLLKTLVLSHASILTSHFPLPTSHFSLLNSHFPHPTSHFSILKGIHNRLQPRSRPLCLTGPRQGKQTLHIGFPLTRRRLDAIADHENLLMLGRGQRLVVRKELLPCAAPFDDVSTPFVRRILLEVRACQYPAARTLKRVPPHEEQGQQTIDDRQRARQPCAADRCCILLSKPFFCFSSIPQEHLHCFFGIWMNEHTLQERWYNGDDMRACFQPLDDIENFSRGAYNNLRR
ncbi:MAG: hypothetical protein ABIL11_01875 [Chloroflexota bacterium]